MVSLLRPGPAFGSGSSRDQISELDLNAAIDDALSANLEKRDKTPTDDSTSTSFDKEEHFATQDAAPEVSPWPSAPPQPSHDLPKARNKFDYFSVTDGGPSIPEGQETTIDVIAVPCPGVKSRFSTWARDDHISSIYGNVSMGQNGHSANVTARERQRIRMETYKRMACQENRARSVSLDQGTNPRLPQSNSAKASPTHSDASAPSWVRHNIRTEAPEASILLVKHHEMTETTTLDELAETLLAELLKKRGGVNVSRPIFFMCHSIGGLVVKLAMIKARNDPSYVNIHRDCYGIAFFGTPHRGSSYLSMKEVSDSIQTLLELEAPLSASIIHDIRSGSSRLGKLNDQFREQCSDMQIWSFYETIDSTIICRTPSPASSNVGDSIALLDPGVQGLLQFTAPLTPVRSAILGIRQEKVFPLQTDHRNCVAFGDRNAHTQKVFLHDLVFHIRRAHKLSKEIHNELSLYDTVMVEVHGYYEDAPTDNAMSTLGSIGMIRPWSNRVKLRDFLDNGAQKCLDDRLMAYNPTTGSPMFSRYQHRNSEPNLHGLFMSGSSQQPPELEAVAVGLGVTLDPEAEPMVIRHRQKRRVVSRSPSRTYFTSRGREERSSDSNLIRQTREDSLYMPFHKDIWEQRNSNGEPVYVDRDISKFYRDSSPMNGFVRREGLKPVSAERRSSYVVNPFDPGRQEDSAPSGLGAPDPTSQKFVWVHLAFNNPIWVEEMMRAMEKDGLNTEGIFSNERWASRFNKGRHAQHYASFMRPTAFLDFDLVNSPNPTSPSRPPHHSDPNEAPPTLTFHIPYLHYDLYPASVRRRQLIEERRDRGRCRPVPERIARIGSLELKTIWEYLSYEFPINCRRTLDQFGFPTLQDTRARDDDQMLYKMTKERYSYSDRMDLENRKAPHTTPSWSSNGTGSSSSKEAMSTGPTTQTKAETPEREKKRKNSKHNRLDIANDLLNGNVLMVDQLWMWAVGPKTLVTFFPSRESDPSEGPLYLRCDLRDNIFNDANADTTRRCEDAYDMAALVILHTVTVLLERPSHQDLEVFRIFEEAISQLTEKLTSALKKFRTSGTIGAETFLSETEHANEGSIRQRYLEENERIEKENRDSTSALLELRDLEDELTTIYNLLTTQQDYIEKMLKNYRTLVLRTGYGRRGEEYLEDALIQVEEFVNRTRKMQKRVTMTRDEYDKLLEMVQRHSQISEVRLQRLQADLASAQGRSVLIFTTFTVIFLPLSFFTSLFGMNTKEWQQELPTFKEVGSVSLPISVFVILLTLLIAFSTSTRAFFRAIGHIFLVVLRLIGEAFVEARGGLKLLTRTKEADDSEKEEERTPVPAKPAVPRDTSDMSFWGRPPPTKDHYEIPPTNRRSVAIERSGQI